MKKSTIALLITIMLAACGTTKLLTPTEEDATRGTRMFPGYTLADLKQGKNNFEQYCSQCHKLKKPSARTEQEWKEIVPSMAKRANEEPDKKHIDQQTQESILRYLITMSNPSR